MDISVREGILTPDTFAGLRAACGMPELEPALVERAIESSLFTLSAVSGHGPRPASGPDGGNEQAKNPPSRTVGMVRVVGDGAFVFLICDLLVVPLWRRRGIGSRLVEEAALRAKAFVPPGRAVVVSLFSVEGRESFYTRLGFTELPATGLGAGMQYFCL